MMKAPRRGLRLAKFQLLLFLLVGFLLPDVLADHLFRQTDGADTVPTRPGCDTIRMRQPPQLLIGRSTPKARGARGLASSIST